MRMWYLSLPACACVTLMLQAASAQVVQVQVQQGKVQVAPVQIQIAPMPAQADLVVAKPGYAVMPANRLAQNDAVVVGRVVAIEPMDVDASAAPGQPNTKYRIAVVQLSEVIHGVKKDTQMIRVGFLPQGNVAPGVGGVGGVGGGIQILPAVQPVPPGFGRRPFIQNVNLDVGQDGIFMLNKHHKENFYLVNGYNGFINRQNNANFDNEVKTAKQIAKVMADPVVGLKSEDRDVRYTAAAVLLTKYRQPSNPTGKPLKLENIDAAESKLILKALAEGDWKNLQFGQPIPNPMELFNQIGAQAKDGYNPVNVRTQQDIAQAMQKWLGEKGESYVVQKLVPDMAAKGPAIQSPEDLPRPVPLPVNPNVRPPIKGKVLPLPAPAPQPLPAPGAIELQPAPAPAVPVPEINRRG